MILLAAAVPFVALLLFLGKHLHDAQADAIAPVAQDDHRVAAAQTLFQSGDVQGAHLKLQELPDPLSCRKDLCKTIEEAWAKDTLSSAERSAAATEKRGLLNEVASTISVPQPLRDRAREMLASLGDAGADSTAAAPDAGPGNPAEEQRAELEPKVWAGEASLDEVKTLRALCVRQRDKACRDRATAILRTQASKRGAPGGRPGAPRAPVGAGSPKGSL